MTLHIIYITIYILIQVSDRVRVGINSKYVSIFWVGFETVLSQTQTRIENNLGYK